MDKVKLKKYYIWDILEIDWSKVKVTFNGKVINLPKSMTDYGINLKLDELWEINHCFFI